MSYEFFDKRAVPTTTQPWVTIQKKGLFSLNRAAVEAFGSPEFVEIGYDRDEQKIAFRPASKSTPRAFQLRKQGAKRETQNPNYLVAGQAFCKNFGIETGFARRYEAKVDQNGMLTVDLKQDYAVATGPRTKAGAEA